MIRQWRKDQESRPNQPESLAPRASWALEPGPSDAPLLPIQTHHREEKQNQPAPPPPLFWSRPHHHVQRTRPVMNTYAKSVSAGILFYAAVDDTYDSCSICRIKHQS
ncbi:hypothetical protein F2P81_000257 [Scophthalmus maximus]|uniref:Uncharacterized protein n=1 Tax=Scophthalmus maximus TaxID=52904 RepID=A0A6A4TTU0_SCOMX|nr:hypothetical protein F2P81_000257 [Scophthalmus maximus]